MLVVLEPLEVELELLEVVAAAVVGASWHLDLPSYSVVNDVHCLLQPVQLEWHQLEHSDQPPMLPLVAQCENELVEVLASMIRVHQTLDHFSIVPSRRSSRTRG